MKHQLLASASSYHQIRMTAASRCFFLSQRTFQKCFFSGKLRRHGNNQTKNNSRPRWGKRKKKMRGKSDRGKKWESKKTQPSIFFSREKGSKHVSLNSRSSRVHHYKSFRMKFVCKLASSYRLGFTTVGFIASWFNDSSND